MGLGRRFLARLLDALVVGVPVSILLAVLDLPAPTMGVGGVEMWLYSAVTAALWLAYYAFFEANGGATIGKRLLRLRVIDAQGADPSLRAAVTRNLWLLFGLVPVVGGIAQLIAVVVIAVTISTDPYHRGKHDELAGTAVMG